MATPGIELTERPWTGSADSRLFASDPGPGNPNVGRETLRAPTAPTTPSAPTTAAAAPAAPTAARPSLRAGIGAQSGLAKATYAGGRLATAGTRVLGPAALGAAAWGHLDDYRIDDPDVDSSAMGTLRAVGQGDFAGAGRSLSKGMLEAGMDVGSMAANAADLVVPGQNTVSSAYDRTLRGAFGDQLVGGQRPASSITPSAQAAEPGPVGVPTATAVSGATPPAPAAPAAAPAAAPSLRTGDVTRVGNAYSGGPNISGDITINGQAPGGGAISAQNMAAADNLAARQSLRSMSGMGGGASFPGRPSMPVPGNSSNSWQARNDLRNLRVGASSITNDKHWGGEGSKSPDVQAYLAAQNADTALRGGMDPGSVARTNAAASMYGDEARADATRYASDNSLRGATASADATRTAGAARLRYDADKDARDFKLREQETGLKRRDSDRAARASEQEAVNKRLETMFRTNVDGKDVADTRKIGEYTRALQATLGSHIERLKATGTPEALAKAAELSARGPAALDDQDHAQLKQLFDRREVSRSSKGVLPWAGTHTESDDLFNYEQNSASPYDNGLLQTQVRTRGGSSIPLNDLRGKNWYGGGTENIDQTKRLRLPQ